MHFCQRREKLRKELEMGCEAGGCGQVSEEV